jgi:hypothetical protein
LCPFGRSGKVGGTGEKPMNVGILSAQLAGPVAVQLATADAELRPRSVRGLGAAFDEPSGVLSLVVAVAQAGALLTALERSRKLAVNLTHPVTLHGVQVKGPLVRIEAPSSEAAEAARRYFEGFVEALAKVGFKPAQLQGMYCSGDTLWVRMQPVELFNQTPGPGAGKAL